MKAISLDKMSMSGFYFVYRKEWDRRWEWEQNVFIAQWHFKDLKNTTETSRVLSSARVLTHTHPPTLLICLYTHSVFLRACYMLSALFKLSAVLDSGFPRKQNRIWGGNKVLIIYFEVQNQSSKSEDKVKARQDEKQCKVMHWLVLCKEHRKIGQAT